MKTCFPCFLIALLLGSAAHVQAQTDSERVACHLTYGGETRVVLATPVTTPYTVPAIEIGSYFLFRLVFQNSPADHAAIKTYTYADRDGSPVPLHQASFPYPPSKSGQHGSGRHGFSGLQFVYEPLRDGELQFWCELQA